ncbi:hypothetical protein, partial [Klebsiella pneumoniae]|uniref:hypothetical protein n=1 Tax=Klebsiella pneumoniae TaxID=573 RepID=UPI003852DA1B
AALINSQPMGFYQPAQLVRDAKEHRVAVLPPDVNASDWDCALEPASPLAAISAGAATSDKDERMQAQTGLSETQVSGLQTADAQIQR